MGVLDSITVRGGNEMLKTLENLGRADQAEFKKAARKSLRAAIKPMLAAARAAARVKTGQRRKALKIKSWTRPAPGEIGVKIINDLSVAHYAWTIESGYIKAGEYIPGDNALGGAYQTHSQKAQKAVAAALSAAADEVINKIPF